MSRPGDDARDGGRPRRRPSATAAEARSIWPAMHPRLLELVRAHRSTILFVNARRLAERLATALNDLAGEEIARAHHGSIAREERLLIEDALKAGELRALVATSTLELGIDMGAVDLVIQIETPISVASGMQRIGRASHQVEAVSRGVLFPKFRADLLATAAVTRAMKQAAVEETRVPQEPARRARAADRGDRHAGRVGRARALRARAPRRPLLRPRPHGLRGRPRHALGPLSRGRVLGPAAAHRVGPKARPGPRARGHPEGRRGERRHDPRPRPLRRLPGRGRGRGPPRGRARRGDGVREPRGRRVRARRLELAHRRDHARPRAGAARPGGARRDAVLEGGPRLAAGRARPRDREADARARGAAARGGARAARARARLRRARRAQPGAVPRRPAPGHGQPARRPHAGARAHARRDGGLAAVPALALGRPRARAVDDRARGVAARARRAGARVDLERRRHRAAHARARAPARGRGAAARPRRARGAGGARAAGDEPLRRPLPRGRGPRAAPAAAAAGPALAAVDAAQARARAAAGGRALSRVPDRARGGARVPERRVRPARRSSSSPGACSGARSAW